MINTLACIDGSAMSKAVCQAATWASLKLETPLVLLHVLEKMPSLGQDDLSGSIGLGSREHLLLELTELDEQRNRLALEHGRQLLQETEGIARQLGAELVSQHQRHGRLLDTVLELEDDTRLLVMGRLGLGSELSPHNLGSQLETVVRAIHRPVLVAVGDFQPPERFLIAYDGSPTADNALDRIAASPLLKGLECHLVTVGKATEQRQNDLERATNLLSSHGFNLNASLIDGEVQPALTEYIEQQQIDLLVMGAYGCSRIREFLLGSNTTRMISRSQIPLLLLR